MNKKSESTPTRPEEATAATIAAATLSMEKQQQLEEQRRKDERRKKAKPQTPAAAIAAAKKKGHHQGDTWQFSFRHPLVTAQAKSDNSLYDVDFSSRSSSNNDNDNNNNGTNNDTNTVSNRVNGSNSSRALLTPSQEKLLAEERLSWAELRVTARKNVALIYADHVLHEAVIKVTPAFAKQRKVEAGLKRAQQHKVSYSYG